MAKRHDEDDDSPTPEELAERAILASVPNGGPITLTNSWGKPVVSTSFFLPVKGTAAALINIFKGKGGAPEAETMVLWNKDDAGVTRTIRFMSNRGRDVAALVKRIGDGGIHSFELGQDTQDYVTINVKLDRFRSTAHAFRASKVPVVVDTELELTRPSDILRALRNLPGTPMVSLAPNQEKWQVYQRPVPGTAARLIEIYKGKGGGPESESGFTWSKWKDTISFSSCRGRDIAALARRLGDDGISGFMIPSRPDWPIFIDVKPERFRTAAHAFKAAPRADGEADDDGEDSD